jgi:hypothetical protein
MSHQVVEYKKSSLSFRSWRLLSDCRTVDVARHHVWKLRLHFIFYYLMRHESYGRHTTDVAVCVASLTRTGMVVFALRCFHMQVHSAGRSWKYFWWEVVNVIQTEPAIHFVINEFCHGETPVVQLLVSPTSRLLFGDYNLFIIFF